MKLNKMEVEDIQNKFQEMLDNIDISEKPKRIDYYFHNRNWMSKKFFDIDLIPHIDLTWDNQMETGIRKDSEVLFYGYKQFTITLSFLGFSVALMFNTLTDKWEDNE